MRAYYNEIEPYCAAWLRNLMAAGLIPQGDVDERSIRDVKPDDLIGYTQCHFFAGLGGWPAALRLAGFPDGMEVWTGSCPCQPFSVAGAGKGFNDDRHLWPVWRDLVAERRPPVVFGEQVAAATDWLRLVRGDLETLGYAVGAVPVEAASAGADHKRDRWWFVGDSHVARADVHAAQGASRGAVGEPGGGRALADADFARAGEGREQRSGQQRGAGGDPRDCDVADAGRGRCGGAREGQAEQPRRAEVERAGALVDAASERRGEGRPEHGVRSWRDAAADASSAGHVADADSARSQGRPVHAERADQRPVGADSVEWIVGADGKARRVKSGVCLLAHGVPARVAKLRALGNAIDLRPAAQFIGAYLDVKELTNV